MYWHRGASPDFEGQVNIEKREMQNEQGRREKDTQHTLIRPVKSDVKFTFTIRFENLQARRTVMGTSATTTPQKPHNLPQIGYGQTTWIRLYSDL